MPVRLTNLHPGEYRHPFDAKAIEALQNTKSVSIIIKKLYEWGLEKYLRQQFLGQSLRMSPTNFPTVYEVFEAACDILNHKGRPQLYVMREQGFNCTTLGVTNTIIIIGTSCIDQLKEEELLFLLGRQIGHIQNQHVQYFEVSEVLPLISEALSDVTLGLGGMIASGIQLAMVEWRQTAHYTADRAGLLACQNIEAAMRVLVQEAGLPAGYDPSIVLDDFKTQAIEFEQINKGIWMKFSKYLTQSVSWEVARAQQLFQWTDSGIYQQVLDRKTQLAEAVGLRFCPTCGTKQITLRAFCANCGGKLPLPA